MKPCLFGYGFRPNFLAAGLAGVLLIPMWAATFSVGISLNGRWPPTLWHGHEMLFGFIAAAIAGFLLTAVPSWTGIRGFAGRPLLLLAALWMAARLLVYVPSLPAWFAGVVDISFFPALAVLIGPSLIRSSNRNSPLLLVPAALMGCNLVFHWAAARGDAPTAMRAIHIGIDIVLVLATVVGGRIVPAFTSSALKSRGLPGAAPSIPALDRLTIGLMLAIVVADIGWYSSVGAALLAFAASAAHVARLSRWRSLSTWRDPLVWILHVGYAWIPVGLLLRGLDTLTDAAAAAFWLHALTVGALTTLILAVMTRAALGHTGRTLKAATPTTAAYVLLFAAAMVRVFGLSAAHGNYTLVVLTAALLWTAAFVLFLVVYAPILCGPRVDGKPG